MKNKETRWNEHKIPSEKPDPSKYLNDNTTHFFNWTVIFNAPVKKFTFKILEVYLFPLLKLTLNDLIELDLLQPCNNGIT